MKHAPWLYFIIAIFFLLLVILGMMFFRKDDIHPQQAVEQYQKGETATTIADRKTAFNEALTIFLTLEKTYEPLFGTGKLYYDIGNTYYNLEEYPWAILYYNRAQRLMPRNEQNAYNLETSIKQLQLPPEKPPSAFSKVMLQTYLSIPEQLQLFCVLSVIAFLFTSCYIWMNHKWCKNGSIVCIALLAWLLVGFTYARYFAPLEAILVKSVELRRDAGSQYAKVNIDPIPAGTKVEVMDIIPDGTWLKIKTSDESLGYVSQESIRLIGGA